MPTQSDEERAILRRIDPASTEHRRHLISCEHQSQQEFDKTLIALSGGALAISFAFVENFIGDKGPAAANTLFAAWICWAASLLAVFVSFFCSVHALRLAVQQFDLGQNEQRPGGLYAVWVEVLNIVGALLFLAGVALMFRFVYLNLKGMQ